MDAKRNFLEVALSTGIECKLISPEDVLRHIEPEIMASHLPDEAKTKLLSASLKAGRMDAGLVFEVIAPRVFAEHMPEHMLWSCLAEAAERVLDSSTTGSRLGAPGTKPASSLLGDTTSSRIVARRPNAARRPPRLSQQTMQPSMQPPRPTTPTKTKPGGEFDIDTDHGANWPKKDASTQDEHFSDWVEETVTGVADAAALNRPESTLTRPESTLARPDSALARPDSALARPDSALARPDSALARPDSALARSDSALNRPKR